MGSKRNVFGFLIAFMLLGTVAGCNDDDARDLRCSLVPEPGPCFALITKYYFDSEENRCKQFDWGGCDGVVPFNTMEECEECVAAND